MNTAKTTRFMAILHGFQQEEPVQCLADVATSFDCYKRREKLQPRCYLHGLHTLATCTIFSTLLAFLPDSLPPKASTSGSLPGVLLSDAETKCTSAERVA